MKGHLLTFFSHQDLVFLVPALACATANALVTLVSAVCLGKIFDGLSNFALQKLSGTQFSDQVFHYVTAIFILAAITTVLHIIMYFCIMNFGELQSRRAKKFVFSSLLAKNMDWFDSTKELIGLINSANQCSDDLRRACSLNFAYLAQSLATILCCIIYSLVKCWSLTLVIMAGVPLLVLVNQLCAAAMSKLLQSNKYEFETSSDLIHWTMMYLNTTRLFGAEPKQASRLLRHLSRLYNITQKIYIVVHLQGAVCKLLIFLGFVEAIYYAQSLVISGKATTGTVIEVFWCCLIGIGSSHAASSLFLFMSKGSAAAQKLVQITSENGTPNCPTSGTKRKRIVSSGFYPQPSRGWVSLKNVYFRYPSMDYDTYALEDCNITFSSGRINFVVGKSGSGKSTLANVILKLYGTTTTTGQLSIDGTNWEYISHHWLRDNIAYMEQNGTIFNMSLVDNVKLGTEDIKFSRSKILNVYENCGINEIIDALPKGEHTILGGEAGIKLSGGQQQRLLLARAVASEKHIMILDEPTSALDAENARKVINHIRELAKKRTVVIITHNLAEVGPNDYLYVMQKGKVIDHGIYWELQQSKLKSYLDNFKDFTEKSMENSEKRRESVFVEKLKDYSNVHRNIHSRLEHEPSRNINETVDNSQNKLESAALFSIVWQIVKTIPRKQVLFLGLLDTVICAALNPVFSYGSSQMMSSFFSGTSTQSDRMRWLVIVNVIVFVDAVFTFTRFILDFESENWIKSLRYNCFKHLIAQPASKLQKAEQELGSKESFSALLMNNLENGRLIVSQLFSDVLTFLVTLLGTVIWCLMIGYKLTLATCSLFPLFILIAFLYEKASNKWEARYELQNSVSMKIVEDCLLGIKTVKAAALEPQFSRQLHLSQQKLDAIFYKKNAILSIGFSLSKSFLYLAQGLIMYYGMSLVSRGEYSTKQVVTVFSMLVFCIVTLDSIMMSISQVGNGINFTAKVLELIKADRVKTRTVVSHTRQMVDQEIEQISFENVTFRYSSGGGGVPGGSEASVVLHDLSLSFPGGQITAIVGPSGCGKSTISLLITRIHDPESGNITINNKDIRSMSLTSLRSTIRVVQQMRLNFFNGTIYDNLLFGQEPGTTITREDIYMACKQTLIHDFIMSLPEGYETMIGGSSDVENDMLSGGQLQRLGIARALVLKPKVLVLDEPTSALDPISTKGILRTLHRLQSEHGTTIIIITHDNEVASHAQSIIELEPKNFI